MRRLAILPLVLVLACRIEHSSTGRPAGTTSDADSLLGAEQDSSVRADVEAALRTYYQRLSARDWRAVRASFWAGGTITTRWTPPGERQPRVWVQTADEFVRREPEGPGRMAVFSERMVHSHVTGYGDLADAWVIYEGRSGRTRDSLKTTRGIAAFHLYRDGDEWRIVSLAFTAEQPSRPLVAPPRRAARRSARSRATPPRSGRRSAS
ncbi:MAG: nuclear transport factor 2 family protein [Gemmatimonadales bacterium]